MKVVGNQGDADDLLAQWHRGIRVLHIAHARAAARYERRGKYLGVPVVVLTAAVGTAIFATVESSPEAQWRILAGLLAGVAAVLSALQTFLNYPVLAQKHRAAEVTLGALRRDLERLRDGLLHGDGSRAELLAEITERWKQIEAEAPIPPEDIYQRALATSFRNHDKAGDQRDAVGDLALRSHPGNQA